MEFIGRTVERDGKEVDEFVLKCSTHDFYYKGLPPLTHGCSDCVLVYFWGQLAQAGGDIKAHVDQLESAIHHAAELADKGQWDFKPEFQVRIDKENEN